MTMKDPKKTNAEDIGDGFERLDDEEGEPWSDDIRETGYDGDSL